MFVRDELDAFGLYSRQMVCPRYTNEEITELASKARAGDQSAREAILSSCLHAVVTLAFRYHVYVEHDDLCDLIGIGNLALVEGLDKALEKERPTGYLIGCARYSILNHVNRTSSLIHRSPEQEPMTIDPIEDVLLLAAQEEQQQCLLLSERMFRHLLSLATPCQREAILIRHCLFGRTTAGMTYRQKCDNAGAAKRGREKIYRFLLEHKHEKRYQKFAAYLNIV